MLCDAKGKDERKNRSVLRASWKRDRDTERQRDTASAPCPSGACARQDTASPPRSPPSPPAVPTRAAMDQNNNIYSGGTGGGSANNAAAAARKHRGPADKMEVFSVPSCPASCPAPLLPSLSSALNHKPLLPSALPSHRAPLMAQNQVRTRSVGTNTQERGPSDGELPQRGPCQPGTSVNLEGIVWHETQEGVLVVNVTWRKRTYVGTLLDCTKHDWAPPRFCESPSSDPELPGGRGRGKRLRLALSDRSSIDSSPAAKVRGLTAPHRSRGGANSSLHSKGRRGSLNLINANGRSSFFTVDDVKATNSLPGKRKNKPPADLDLSIVSTEDIKNTNGKRIRAKSRSAPSTPQGKNDPSFMDPGGGGLPILIDCPHPNCTKRYKHINGLRYHQTHAHLEAEEQRKPDADAMKDADSEGRLSDCEDGITGYNIPENPSKKAAPLYKVTTVGSSKNRRLLLSTDQSTKTRRTSVLKDGLIDDLTNLPIISNMTVVLENCMVPDRNSSVEMPKLEAEGLIDKKSKKANGKVEKTSKSRINRPIAPAPAPPKLIAIPNTTYANSSSENTASQQQPLSLTSKNIPLKPIKPKLSIVVEPSLVKATVVGCSKDMKKKEKRKLKDKLTKDGATRAANGDACKAEENGTKMPAKEISGSLLKEHLSKQDVINGLAETQESRMASIRAEADKVYTFTDNAPSPSIGASRADGSGADSKNNSPAYSDISDAGEDGAARATSSSSSSEASANPNHLGKNTAKETPQSPYYHGYDPYYLQGYVPSERHKKERKEETKDEDKDFPDSKKPEGQSQLQLAMSQTALAQSLYYGQYSRGMYMEPKFLGSKCCDQKQRGRDSDEVKHAGSSGRDAMKSPKAVHSYMELSAGDRGQMKDSEEGPQSELDSSAPFTTPSDGGSWTHRYVHGKYGEEEVGGATELRPSGPERDKKKNVEEPEEQQQGALCEESQSARAAVSPPSPQPYVQYHPPAYPPYLPSISEPSAGSYRGLSPTLVHSYPGFHYPLYGKTAGREEQEGAVTRGGAVSSKHSDTGVELLPPSHQFHGKSPAPGEKGSPEADSERTHVSFGRHLHSHHSPVGLGYGLVPPQYDLYQGLSSRSLVSGQQGAGHSSAESEGKK